MLNVPVPDEASKLVHANNPHKGGTNEPMRRRKLWWGQGYAVPAMRLQPALGTAGTGQSHTVFPSRNKCRSGDSCQHERKVGSPTDTMHGFQNLSQEMSWEGNGQLGWLGMGTKQNVLRVNFMCFCFHLTRAFSPSENRVNSCAELKKNLIWCSLCVYLYLKGKETY